jgi:hypothetical protein
MVQSHPGGPVGSTQLATGPTARPMDFTVLRLTTVSYLVGALLGIATSTARFFDLNQSKCPDFYA